MEANLPGTTLVVAIAGKLWLRNVRSKHPHKPLPTSLQHSHAPATGIPIHGVSLSFIVLVDSTIVVLLYFFLDYEFLYLHCMTINGLLTIINHTLMSGHHHPLPQKPSERCSFEALHWTTNFQRDPADADDPQASVAVG